MENLGIAQTMEHVNVNGKNAWHYLIPTNLSDIHVVQYEGEGFELHDTYIGFSDQKAEQAFKRVAKKMLKI